MGLMAYRDPKGERDKRMSEKRRSSPGVRGGASRDPRDMAKAASAPRGAKRKEMTDIKHLVRAGWNAGPGLLQRPGEAGDGQGAGSRAGGQASRQRDGRVVLPDARVRASETER